MAGRYGVRTPQGLLTCSLLVRWRVACDRSQRTGFWALDLCSTIGLGECCWVLFSPGCTTVRNMGVVALHGKMALGFFCFSFCLQQSVRFLNIEVSPDAHFKARCSSERTTIRVLRLGAFQGLEIRVWISLHASIRYISRGRKNSPVKVKGPIGEWTCWSIGNAWQYSPSGNPEDAFGAVRSCNQYWTTRNEVLRLCPAKNSGKTCSLRAW